MGCTGGRARCTLTINNMHINIVSIEFVCHPDLGGPSGRHCSESFSSGIGNRRERGNLGGKDKNKGVPGLLDNVRAAQEEDKGWRHSKGSASPSATNDSWRAPDSISGLENSGDNAGVQEHQQQFWKNLTKK